MSIVKLPAQSENPYGTEVLRTRSEGQQKLMTVYVERKLNSLNKEHEQEVKNTYYLGKEYSEEEYKNMIQDLDEKINFPPKDKITLTDETINKLYGINEEEYKNLPDTEKTEIMYHINELQMQLRKAYVDDCENEKQLILRDMKRTRDYKLFISKTKRELESYPKSTDELMKKLNEYITKTINYYHKDIVDSCFDLFVNKINQLCPEDKNYSRTIESVYRNRGSKKAMDIFAKFFETMKNKLILMVMNIKRCESIEFCKMYQILKNEIKKLIEKMHYIIYNFYEQQINYIDSEEEMSDSRIVKMYTETCMSQINQALISELPPILDEELKIVLEDRIEDLQCVWKREIGYEFINQNNKQLTNDIKDEPKITIVEVDNKPLVAEVIDAKPVLTLTEKPSLENFISTVPDGWIDINDLTEMYNKYFGTNVSNIGFSKIKGIKDLFTKKRNNKTRRMEYMKI